ncbi:hypothetical protein HOY81_26065, partial [Streptomyces sp. JJ36]|nr:hypothetical protein [Streptomyces sp. JJ36]
VAEPAARRAQRAAAARTHGVLAAALHGAVTGAGALCRPPHTGRHLYADLEPARPALAAHGIRDAAGLEAELVRRLGPGADGGHRFGDDPHALRVRLSTRLLIPAAATATADEDTAGAALAEPPDPGSDAVRAALDRLRAALVALTGPPQPPPPG